jgi:hypothetical protein
MELVGHTACMGELRNAYKIIVRKPEVNRSLGAVHISVRIILKF